MSEHPARQILIATDFSDSAEAAFRLAVQYARALHARLHLLHVYWSSEVEVTRLLADAAAQAGPDVPVTVAGTGGDPADEILRYATRHPIDLIVVGNARAHRREPRAPRQRGRAGDAWGAVSRAGGAGAGRARDTGAVWFGPRR